LLERAAFVVAQPLARFAQAAKRKQVKSRDRRRRARGRRSQPFDDIVGSSIRQQAAEPSDLGVADAYADVAEYFLFDAPAAANATRPGGHGVAFDWKMLNGRRFSRPWFLAGGLKPDNVARAAAASGAAMVDVSSGVESAPGVKSDSLIAEFIAAAKQKAVA